jgi:uncharacterized membrane protein
MLALMYAAHLLATVVWIGGLVMLVLAAAPQSSESQAKDGLFGILERRFRPWSQVSLAVLLVTGLIQMGGDSHYHGFLIVDSPWVVGLLGKHIVIGLIVVLALVLQGWLYPALERARLLALRRSATDQQAERILRGRLRQLTYLNLGLGIIVLLLTAFITAIA